MDVGLLVRLTVVLAVGAFVAWVGGLLVGLGASSLAAAVVLRTVLSLLVLVLLTRMLVRRTHASPALPRTVALGAVLSYAVFPPAWGGRALFAQQLVEPGPAATLIDLVPWVTAVVLASRTTAPRPAPATYQPYQSR